MLFYIAPMYFAYPGSSEPCYGLPKLELTIIFSEHKALARYRIAATSVYHGDSRSTPGSALAQRASLARPRPGTHGTPTTNNCIPSPLCRAPASAGLRAPRAPWGPGRQLSQGTNSGVPNKTTGACPVVRLVSSNLQHPAIQTSIVRPSFQT